MRTQLLSDDLQMAKPPGPPAATAGTVLFDDVRTARRRGPSPPSALARVALPDPHSALPRSCPVSARAARSRVVPVPRPLQPPVLPGFAFPRPRCSPRGTGTSGVAGVGQSRTTGSAPSNVCGRRITAVQSPRTWADSSALPRSPSRAATGTLLPARAAGRRASSVTAAGGAAWPAARFVDCHVPLAVISAAYGDLTVVRQRPGDHVWNLRGVPSHSPVSSGLFRPRSRITAIR